MNDNNDVGVSVKVRPVSASACHRAVTLFSGSLQLSSIGTPATVLQALWMWRSLVQGWGESDSAEVLPFPSCLPPFSTHGYHPSMGPIPSTWRVQTASTLSSLPLRSHSLRTEYPF